MKIPPTISEAIANRRKIRLSLFYRWLLLLTILLVNIFLAYVLFQQPINPYKGVAKIETANGTGTGFLVTENLMLTAAHVVENVGNAVNVLFPDGSEVSGTVVASGYSDLQQYGPMGEGTPYDWALIELEQAQDPEKIIPLGETGSLNVGDELYVVGYPGGMEQNVSKGILSGMDENELRTDAPADPGYSGGPVISIDQLAAVGIVVSAPVIEGEAAQSVRNAVPIEIVIENCEQAGYPIE